MMKNYNEWNIAQWDKTIAAIEINKNESINHLKNIWRFILSTIITKNVPNFFWPTKADFLSINKIGIIPIFNTNIFKIQIDSFKYNR